jgi:predicted nucleotidyltransferase
MVAKDVIDVVSKFVKALQEKGLKVEKVVLFGSQVKGKVREESDIDIAIISPDFGKDRYEESKMLRQIAWRIDTRLEPIPISKESFLKDEWIPLIYEIKRTGISLDIAV